MSFNLSGYLSAGYFLTKRVSRPSWASPDLLPEKILSVSESICTIIPDTWCIEWTGDSTDRREAKAQEFTLSSDALKSMTSWITERLQSKIGWPGVCYSLETVQTLAQQFLSHDSDIVMIGLGLHEQYRDVLCRAAEPPPIPGYSPIGRQGVHEAILKGKRMVPGGKPLGFEPLVFNYSLSDSWLSNGLEVLVHDQLGIVPNTHGFLDDFEVASRCVEYISRDDVGAEPGLWLPWLLVEYTNGEQEK